MNDQKGRLVTGQMIPQESAGQWPVPFRQFILKVQSRCNLACTYCYIYEMADRTWRSQPVRMAIDTVSKTALRIAEHAQTHGLSGVRVILHGGEPLLAGCETIATIAQVLRRTIPRQVHLDLRVQTNGVLLDEEFLRVLLEHDVVVGVSIDGARGAHDRHRQYPGGRGSYDDVVEALRLLRREPYRRLFGGLLCTIDLKNDPLKTYETLLGFTPPAVDFLLPHGNWTTPPPHRVDDPASTPYADWLIPIFDRWYQAPSQETGVRLFESIIQLLLGGRSRTELVGLTPSTVLTIETNGAIEQVDTLKAAYDGAAGTGLNVFDHEFNAVLSHPSIIARQRGVAGLSPICRQCSVRRVCGGGYYPHRYRAGSGFRNPSVYCSDLRRLIEHIHRRVDDDLGGMLERCG